MANDGHLSNKLSQKTTLFGLKLWVLIGMAVGIFIVLILFILSLWLVSRKKSKQPTEKLPAPTIPADSKDIQEVIKVDRVLPSSGGILLAITDNTGDGEAEKVLVRVGVSRRTCSADINLDYSKDQVEMQSFLLDGFQSTEEGSPSRLQQTSDTTLLGNTSYNRVESQECGFPMSEDSHFGWGHWFTLRDLQVATDGFSHNNVLGEGGYGIVYKGQLATGTMVAVKSLLNNMGQAEREFRIEVEAIGRVRHKNLVRLLGYCMEGAHRMLVYEYVDNGNLEQWLHAGSGNFTWENRMKIILGTAKA